MKDARPAGTGIDINMSDIETSTQPAAWADATRNAKPKDMTLFELVLFSAKHDCHARIWDWLHVTPPKALLQRSVGRTMEYLAKDDALIERDGGFAALGKVEVERACVERGIAVVGRKEEDMRKALGAWRGGKM